MIETRRFFIDVGNLSDAGGREKNEDYHAYYATDTSSIFILSDGMGGHAGGEVASLAAVSAIKARFLESPQEEPRQLLMDCIEAAHGEIQRQAGQSPEYRGMGATCVVLLITSEETAWCAHVGDSRLYLFNSGKLVMKTRDHSLVQSLVSIGQLTPSEALSHPNRNAILQALGMESPIHPELSESPRAIEDGDTFLLCSDGLWELVGDEDLASCCASAASAQDACIDLVDLAKSRGRDDYDNITIQVIRITRKAEARREGAAKRHEGATPKPEAEAQPPAPAKPWEEPRQLPARPGKAAAGGKKRLLLSAFVLGLISGLLIGALCLGVYIRFFQPAKQKEPVSSQLRKALDEAPPKDVKASPPGAGKDTGAATGKGASAARSGPGASRKEQAQRPPRSPARTNGRKAASAASVPGTNTAEPQP